MVNAELISRIDELKDQFNQVKNSDVHAALELADRIYQLAVEAGYWSAASKAQADKAFTCFQCGQYAEGMVPAQNALYLAQELKGKPVKVSRLARGLPTGSPLEFANKAVLADAITCRQQVTE